MRNGVNIMQIFIDVGLINLKNMLINTINIPWIQIISA